MRKLAIVLAAALLPVAALAEVTVTLTADPAQGDVSVTPTLTWSSTGAASCTASGGWSGVKAPSGSETLPAINVTTTYNLSCSADGGEAVLTWTPPTKRTDGSDLTNLAQYGIFVGGDSANLSKVETIPAGGTTYTLTGLAEGPTFFAMTALDANGVESVKSNSVSKTVVAASAAANTTVTIQSAPNPPVLTAVEGTVVYELNLTGNGEIRLGRAVGTMTESAVCGTFEWTNWKGEGYYEVPNGTFYLSKAPKSNLLVAACKLI